MPRKSKFPRLRVHVKRGKAGQVWTSYWFDMRGTGQPDIPLGTDRAAAIVKWAELTAGKPRHAGTIEEAMQAWERDALPNLNSETGKDYARCLKRLRPVFGPAAWQAVKLKDLRGYLQARSAKTRGNREMSVLQIIWHYARMEGFTEEPWPAAGMEKARWRNTETARDMEVTPEVFSAIYRHADQVLRDAMDIASATGIRVRDVLGLRLSDVRGDKLHVVASKTRKRAEFDISASTVLPPIIERRRASKSLHLFLLDAGRRVTYRMLNDRFVAAREKAAKEVPECADLILRDMRKMAAQLSTTLQEASELLQHSSTAVTKRHYRGGDKLKPVR